MRRLLALLVCAAWCCAAQEEADWVWTARYVVTAAEAGVIEDGAVAVRENRIVGVGPREEIEQRFSASSRLDQPNAILVPGFINTHTHAAMSLFRGIANDRKLEDWLQNYIFPAEARNVDREFVRWGTRLALLEMALSGTTTFADMYYFEDTVAEETKRAGLRGVLGSTVIGFPAPDFKTTDAMLAGAEAFLRKYDDDPLIVPAVAPHAIYTTPDDVLRAAREVADRHQKPLLIHLAETKTEFDEARTKRGKTPTEALSDLGVLSGKTVVAHAVWLDDNDIALLAAHTVGVAHNPSSNMMLASGIAKVPQLLARGVAVGLGTDGVAGSNNDHDLMEEMDLAAKLQKVATGDPTALSARQAFEMATIGGARALGMSHVIGSLEVGKFADIVSLRVDTPRAQPVYDIYAQIVYALKGTDVTDVMVNGAMIVRGGRMQTINAAETLAKAEEYQRKVAASLAPEPGR
jgi:5-methylthioadenosine/S-adenosylhomocysteine deaminase